MITSVNEIQIRYDEVDKMGYVYHGNYAKYFHISRTELLRKLGLNDKKLEDHNIILPIIEMNIKYIKPVYYDDIITITTFLLNIPDSRMKFRHEVRNINDDVINEANSTVVFVDMKTRMPMRAPEFIVDKITPYFENELNMK